jgi:hypothetical protein
MNIRDNPFPTGLPDNLLQKDEKDESGIAYLFSVLQMSHDICRVLASQLPKTLRHKKLSVREKLILYYSESETRFKLFESFIQEHHQIEKSASDTAGFFNKTAKSYKNSVPIRSQVQIPFCVPSLEFQILDHYCPDFLETSYEPDKLAHSITAWEDIRETIESYHEDIKKSLMVWLTAQNDLANWDTLTAEQKTHLANVIFAIATLAQSHQLILQATQQVPDLESYYLKLLTTETDSSPETHQMIDTHSLEKTWKTLCAEMLETAQQAQTQPPSIEFIDAIENLSRQFHALRDQIPNPEQALETFKHQLEELKAFLVELNQREFFDGLQPNLVEQLEARWMLHAHQQETVADIHRVTQDIERVFSDISPLVDKYQALSQQFAQLTAKLATLPLEEQPAALGEMSHINEQRANIKQDILNCASPFQEIFDTKQDYVTAWQNFAGQTEPQPEQVTQTPVDSDSGKPAAKTEIETKATLSILPEKEEKDSTSNTQETSQPEKPPQEEEPPSFVQSPEQKAEISEQILEKIRLNQLARVKSAKLSKSLTIQESSQKLAQEVANNIQRPDFRLTWLNQLIWRLVYDNRLGMAYHIAQCVETLHTKEASQVSTTMLKALSLSSLVNADLGEVVSELQSDIPQIISDCQQKTRSHQTELNLLAFALALRPALLAPITTASQLLPILTLDKNFDPLHQLREAILNYTKLGLTLSPEILKGVGKKAYWDEALKKLQSECQDWLIKNREVRFQFGRTRHVWQHWLKDDQLLGSMLTAIIQNNRDQKTDIEQTLKQFSPKHIHQLLQKTDQALHGKKVKARSIDNAAKQAVSGHVQPALDFAKRWLDLLHNEHQELKSFDYERANQCRLQILEYLHLSQKQLPEFLQHHSPLRLEMVASVAAVERALQDLATLFDPKKSSVPASDSLSWQLFLQVELLRIPQLSLDDQWQIQSHLSQEDFLTYLIDLLKNEECLDWYQAFEEQSEVGNHLATQRIIAFLEQTQKTPKIGELIKQRENALQTSRNALEYEITETQLKVEHAMAYGLLAETKRLELLGNLGQIVPSKLINCQMGQYALEQVIEEIAHIKQDRIQEIDGKLQQQAIQDQKPEAYQRIKAVLAQGDFLTANEYIAMVEADRQLPKENEKRDAFEEFFPQFINELMEVLGRMDKRELRHKIQNITRKRVPSLFSPIDMQHVPGAQARTAAKMLEAWLIAKEEMSNDLIETLREILDAISFQNVELTPVQEGSSFERHKWFEMRVHPIKDRDTCIIPRFGSITQGFYRLLCLWGRPSEEEILSLTARQAIDIPIMIFYFGRLTEQRRRDLAYLCRERRRTLLVVDETLIYFLCNERGLRLPILFQCAFPFTVNNPFTTTGSTVPIEMFFGRKGQRESILSTTGTSLIYGGRQVGKTALLLDIARQYHNPPAGVIVLWIDLKPEHIGLNRPPEDIWLVIANALQRQDILPPQVRKPHTIKEKIQDWLDQNPQRRILLLLDEADAFLYQDAEIHGENDSGFNTLIYLKKIMEDTERRFKVVFAGLHNVQRTARDINTPIAHLGTPVCIGPLLGNGEEREARKLIELPFWMLGYRFESPDLLTRILSLTNYYPSLIQLFCWHLLEYLTDNLYARFDSKTSPPYMIKSDHIEDAYQRQELRKAIIDRFKWTLNLDPRYRIIALRIALESVERRQQGLLYSGFQVDWIRTEALSLWQEGFEDQSYEAFRTLLDEMIGLGVLRKVGEQYDLRSPNVINLLGTYTEIEEALLDAIEEQPPLVYEAASFRRALATKMWLRSPLTGQQESELLANKHSVAVLFGVPIAGLEEVESFLKCACESTELWHFEVLEDEMTLTEFQEQLSDALQEKASSKLIVIPASMPWDTDWVLAANNMVQRKRSEKIHFRVLFVGHGQQAWRWIDARTHDDRLKELAWYSLHPWRETAVRHWMSDAGFGNDMALQRKNLQKITGNWGRLLYEIGSKNRTDPNHWEQHLNVLEKALNDSPEQWRGQLDLVPESIPVLTAMSDYREPITVEELSELSEQSDELVKKVIDWADLLNFVKQGEQNTWLLDALVSRLI